MTRMKLVPAEITNEIGHALESNLAEPLPPCAVHAANWREVWGKAIAASPNGGKVSQEDLAKTAKAICKWADEDPHATNAKHPNWRGWHQWVGAARAAFGGVGLEVEE